MKTKINNLEQLRIQKATLKLKLAEKENSIENKLDYLEHNAGIILIKSVIPDKIKDNPLFDSLTDFNEMIRWIFPSFDEKTVKYPWLKSIPFVLNLLSKILTRPGNK